MVYIDWYLEKTKERCRIFEGENKNYKKWKDPVTETGYYISEEDYNRIFKIGKEKLEQYQRENKLEEIEEIFYKHEETENLDNCKEIEDIDLFPILPYFIEGETETCARICDYMLFQTACLYILKYKLIQNNADREAEKRKIRIQGLTWGIVENSEKSMELEEIRQAWKEGANTKYNLLKQKADLVKGGTIKIKQYYLETNKIPEIRGASLLLEEVNKEKVKTLIEQIHIRECLIYAGGGKMMGIFPEGCGKDICQRIEYMIEEETITAQSNFCSHSYEIQRLFFDYKELIEEMDLVLEEHQGLRWDFRIEPQVKLKPEVLEELKGRNLKKIDGTKEFCTSCRNRYALVKYLYENSEEALCQSCFYKRLKGGKQSKHLKYETYKNYIKKTKKQNKLKGDYFCNNLQEIAEDGFIGVIYGDANNMSQQINKLDSFMRMRYFSEMTADIVTNIVYEALSEHSVEKFEIIAVGGDDIFLIVSGKKAYDVACTIGKLFDEKFQNKSSKEKKMTMSIGVCITHDKMHVQYSFDIAQELLKSAKQKAWKERKNGVITGTIDWMVIENEMAGSAGLNYLRKTEDGKPEKTLRPYTWKQAEAMKTFIKQIKEEKSFAFQLRQSWYQHTKEESELFYEYQIARKREEKKGKEKKEKKEKEKKDIGNYLEDFAKELGGKAVKNNILYQEKIYTPWIDVIELWDYVEGMK